MDWETVQKVRQAQKSAQGRMDDQLALNNELMQTLLSTEGARRDRIPALTELESMIFRMKTQLIDYIVEHGLVQGFIFDGVIQAIQGGNIVITSEMIADVARKEGFPNLNDVIAEIDKALVDGSYVSDPDYVHTDNNFTTAEKQKLNGIEAGAEVNSVIDVTFNGTSVLDGSDRVAKIIITPEEVKAWYESNPNTNAFSDADKIKLDALRLDAEANKVDDVLVDDRSVVNSSKQAIITKEIIKQSYESNPDTNAFTNEEKAHLQEVFDWKPEAIQRMNDIEKRHGEDIEKLDTKFTAQYLTVSAQLAIEHDRITHIQGDLAEDEEDLIRLQQKHAEDVENLENQIKENDTDISGLNVRLTSAESTIGTHTQEITDLKDCCSEVGTRLATMSSQILTLSSQIITLSSQIIQSSSQIASSEAKIKRINEVLAEVEKEQGEQMADITSMKQDIQDVTEKANGNEVDIAELQADVASNVSDISELKACCHTVSSQLLTMSSQMLTMSSQIVTLSSQVAGNTTEITNIKDAINDLELQGLELLWENPNPSEAFEQQVISLGDYRGEFITVLCADSEICSVTSSGLGYNGNAMFADPAPNLYFSARNYLYFSESGTVSFGSGYRSESSGSTTMVEENSRMIPIRIYGGIGSVAGSNKDDMKLLWSNANPNSSFDSQTIELKNNGSSVTVVMADADSQKIMDSVVIEPGNQAVGSYMSLISNAGDLLFASRAMHLDSSGTQLFFSSGAEQKRGTDTYEINNIRLVPIRVYEGINFGKVDNGYVVDYDNPIWINGNPNNPAEPQVLTLENAPERVVVSCELEPGSSTIQEQVVKKGTGAKITYIRNRGETYPATQWSRGVSYSDSGDFSIETGITMDLNGIGYEESNSAMIPIAIYPIVKASKVKSKNQIVTLWENPNPTQEVDTLQINIDTSEYDYWTVMFRINTSNSKQVSFTSNGGVAGSIMIAETNGFSWFTREVSHTQNGFYVYPAYGYNDVSTKRNTYMIPVSIIGIRETKQ